MVVPTPLMTQGATKERLRPFKPSRFGRYTLLMPLSTGGMGEVSLARLEGAQGFEKLCVIKKILPHLAKDGTFLERFVDEAHILGKLSHGNIAQVLDMGLHEGSPYIALEFVDGKDLRRVLARARERSLQLPLSFVLSVATRVLDALAYAHRKRGDDELELNLVHRDISPQNILISYEGEVKVIDFGLAKSTMSATHTHPSVVLGKFLYMSPEQARHQKADRRSDLYAVGVCLYELISGANPFDGIPQAELMAAVAHPALKPLAHVEPLCPPALSEVVMKALAPDPAARFQSAEELRARLLAILLEVDAAAGPETAARFMREAFSSEYQSERRLLAALKEQARGLQGVAEALEVEPALTPSPEAPMGVTREVPSAPLPPLTLEALPSLDLMAQGGVGAMPVKAEALSFAPTRKAPPSPGEKPRPAMADMSTMPSIVVAPEAPAKMTDQLVAAAFAPGGAPEEPARNPSAKSEAARKALGRNTNSGLKAPRGAATARAEKVEKVERETPPDSQRKLAAKATPLDVAVAPAEPDTRAPMPMPAFPPEKPRSSQNALVWVSVPLLAVLAVASYIGWDVYTERLRAQQLSEAPDAVEPVLVVERPRPPERSREVKVTVDPVVALKAEPDDLAPLPRDTKKKPAPPVVKAPEVKSSAGENAIKALRADLKLIVDDSVARSFVLKTRVLDDAVAKRGNDAAFLAEVKALHAQVKTELEKQQ